MSRKKGKWMDRGMGILLILFVVGIVFVVVSIVSDTMRKKNAEENTASSSAIAATGSPETKEEEKEVDEKYITRYSCVISAGNESEDSGSIFYLELNEKDQTYKEYLKAGSTKSELNHGTFTRTDESIETVNSEKAANTLYMDGEYLISKNALYDGEVPDKKTFKKTFVTEVEGESKIELKFNKNGSFIQNVVRDSAGLDGSDTSDTAEGTYVRKGKFIKRTNDNGEKMMSLYVYKGKLCSKYYKLEKKSSINI